MAHRYNGRRADLKNYGALQCERLILLGVGQQKQLYVTLPAPKIQADDMGDMMGEGIGVEMDVTQRALKPDVYNKLGHLLLPTCVPQEDLGDLDRRLQSEALVMWDSQGRVHQVVLDDCLFLNWMQFWAPPQYREAWVWLRSVSHDESRLYAAPPFANTLLRLPEDMPPEFREWQPQEGEYQIRYDQLGRVFSVVGCGDSVRLDTLWETRLWPVVAHRQPQQQPQQINNNNGGDDDDIKIEF